MTALRAMRSRGVVEAVKLWARFQPGLEYPAPNTGVSSQRDLASFRPGPAP